MSEAVTHADECAPGYERSGICICSAQGTSFPESTIRARMAALEPASWEYEAWASILRERHHTERVMEQMLSGLTGDNPWWGLCALASMRRYWQEKP